MWCVRLIKVRQKLTYLISSHVNYYERTLPVILPTILQQISPEDVFVTVGECDTIQSDFGVEINCVPYNAYEYSSLIWLVESKGFRSDYVMLLHDTMYCGKDFAELSNRFSRSHYVTMAHPKGLCNLGVYNSYYLLSIADKLQKMKNITKARAVHLEGRFFGKPATYANARVVRVSSPAPVYGGIMRSVDYYQSVDVYKCGANFPDLFRSGIMRSEL